MLLEYNIYIYIYIDTINVKILIFLTKCILLEENIFPKYLVNRISYE